MQNHTVRRLIGTTALSGFMGFSGVVLAQDVPPPAQDANGVYELAPLPADTNSAAYAVSADGSVVVGFSGTSGEGGIQREAVVWTYAGSPPMYEAEALGNFGESTLTFLNDVSDDGSIAVGSSLVDGSVWHAMTWTRADGFQELPGFTYGYTAGYGISGDGLVAVGQSVGQDDYRQAVRWDGGVISGIGYLNLGAHRDSEARAANVDGSVIVGRSFINLDTSTEDVIYQSEAFRWTEEGGMQGIGHLNPESVNLYSQAYGVSADGAVVVGKSRYQDSGEAFQAFRWTAEGGMEGLGFLEGDLDSGANDVSGDGLVIVGTSSGEGSQAFRWTEESGMQTIGEWLAENDILLTGPMPANAYGTNADGSVVVGDLDNSHAFVARVGGLITPESFLNDARQASLGGDLAVFASDLVMHGAHSRPTSRLVKAGKSTFWVAGDWGRTDHGSNDGDTGMAELGLGHNYGGVQINVAGGMTYLDQTFANNSNVEGENAFGLLEAIMALPVKNLFATVTGYYQAGDIDIRRAYINAGQTDYSTGSPDLQVWSLRARLDWQNCLMLDSAAISPFVDVTYTNSTIDAYTETGGGFPAQFAKRDDDSTVARTGFNLSNPIGQETNLLLNGTAAYRFDDETAAVAGQVIGLFAFNMPGVKRKQFWGKGGLGLETILGGGKASVMVNGTTEGDMPSAWLAASFQATF